MYLVNAIIGVIMLGICILPFILLNQRNKRNKKKSFQSLVKIANLNNCTIHDFETCGDYVIGIDVKKKFVFFKKDYNKSTVEESINLAEILNCKVLQTTRTVSNKDGKQNVIEKLELVLAPIDKNSKEIKLEFYNETQRFQLVGEIKSIEKWCKTINEVLIDDVN